MSGRNRTEIISTLGVTVPTSHRWPMGDEGKQAMLQGGGQVRPLTLINTLGETVPTSHHWPLGDEGNQAKKFGGGVSGPPPYPG